MRDFNTMRAPTDADLIRWIRSGRGCELDRRFWREMLRRRGVRVYDLDKERTK